ncbi:MAG TPA: hypothetical protein DD435_08730 [Cyanobacteria bacterium UBA8530]|nr:hypothetical protein [Cyanobacteria bacterium UBA8530]
MYWFVIDTQKKLFPDDLGYCLSCHGSESDAEAAAIPLRYGLADPDFISVEEADYHRLRSGYLKQEGAKTLAPEKTVAPSSAKKRNFTYFTAISKNRSRLAPVVHAVLPDGFVSSRLIRTPNEYLCGGKIFDSSRSLRVPNEPVSCPRCILKLQALADALLENLE